jgi:hypothetical protein
MPAGKAGTDPFGSCLICTVVDGVSVATNLAGAVVLPAVKVAAVVPVLFGCVVGLGEVLFLTVFLTGAFAVLLCCLAFAKPPALFRLVAGPDDVGAFLFVPPGVVTSGAAAPVGGGEMTRSGDRLVDETTLAALAELAPLLAGCTFGATPTDGSLLESSIMAGRLLNDVEGRKAPNPSSTIPSFFDPSAGRSEEPNKDGISTFQYEEREIY